MFDFKKLAERIGLFLISATLIFSVVLFAACGGDDDGAVSGEQDTLDLSDVGWTYRESEKYGVQYYMTRNVWYCSNPVSENYQTLNIYVPAAYMNADGSLIKNGKCGSFTTETAPILYVNSFGGYNGNPAYEITATTADDNYIPYLGEGCVVVFVGERGRNTTGTDGSTGQAPITLVDLKAGIRYLKHNKEYLAGDTEKIVSIGTSAGGAMSALVGTTGNSAEYDEYFEEMGAFTDVTDDVYAAQVFCPITDLEHADMAYEWMFNLDYLDNTTESQLGANGKKDGDWTEFDKALSSALASNYVDYINGLELKEGDEELTFEKGGRSGSMYEWLMDKLEESATIYLSGLTASEREDYLSGKYVSDWLSYSGGKATIGKGGFSSELDAMVYSAYRTRYKDVCAFDSLNLDTNENSAFGSSGINDAVHFSQPTADTIYSLLGEYDEAQTYYVAYEADLTDSNRDIEKNVGLYNPLNYVDDGETDTAPHFRIRLGSQDADTSYMISATLALELEMAGIDVDYGFVWDEVHTNADRPGEFMEWIKSICS